MITAEIIVSTHRNKALKLSTDSGSNDCQNLRNIAGYEKYLQFWFNRPSFGVTPAQAIPISK